MQKFIKSVAMAILVLIAIHVRAQHDCVQLAKYGMFDTSLSTSEYQRTISYLNIFKQDREMTYEEATGLGLNLGIPIGDVLASLGFDLSSEGFSKFREAIQNSVNYDDAIVNKTMSFVRKVNPSLVNIVDACFRDNGVHAYYETSDDPQMFVIKVRFKWAGNQDPVRLKLQWTGTDFTIDNQAAGSISGGKIEFKLNNGAQQSFLVKRGKNESLGFTINSRSSVPIYGSSFVLPKIKAPAPEQYNRYLIKQLEPITTRKTVKATHCGGDRELKKFETTNLQGNVCLALQNDKLILKVNARIKQTIGDGTCFQIDDDIELYKAPAGYTIVSYKVDYLKSTCYELVRTQKQWQETVTPMDAIFESYRWQGDSGKTDDSKDGCWLSFTTRPITIRLEKDSMGSN